MDQSEMDRMQDPRAVQLENLRRLAGILEGLKPEQYTQLYYYNDSFPDRPATGCAWGWYVKEAIAKPGEDAYTLMLDGYDSADEIFGVDFAEFQLLFFGGVGSYGNKDRTLAQQINLVRGVIRGHEMLFEADAQTLHEMLAQAPI